MSLPMTYWSAITSSKRVGVYCCAFITQPISANQIHPKTYEATLKLPTLMAKSLSPKPSTRLHMMLSLKNSEVKPMLYELASSYTYFECNYIMLSEIDTNFK